MHIWFAVKRLWLAVVLIALTSGVLLVSDLGRCAGAASRPAGAPKQVAVLRAALYKAVPAGNSVLVAAVDVAADGGYASRR